MLVLFLLSSITCVLISRQIARHTLYMPVACVASVLCFYVLLATQVVSLFRGLLFLLLLSNLKSGSQSRLTAALLPNVAFFLWYTGEASASFRSLKTALFSLGLSHWKRFLLVCTSRSAI